MASKSDKMYGNSPTIKKGEDGKVVVGKHESKAAATNAGVEGMPVNESHAHERRSMHMRHEHELMAMHHRHEHEHQAHEMAKGGSKMKLHEKHESEHKEMHTRHHSEMKKMHAAHEKGETPESGKKLIEKVEGDKKTGAE